MVAILPRAQFSAKSCSRLQSLTCICPCIGLVWLGIFLVAHQFYQFQCRRENFRLLFPGNASANLPDSPVKPQVVVVAGGHRVGSTHLYNMFRMLIAVRDPNLLSGALLHLENIIPVRNSTEREGFNRLKVARSHGSFVIKSHELDRFRDFVVPNGGEENFLDGIDLIVLPFRDLRHQISSRARMGWGSLHRENSEGWVQAAHAEIRLQSDWKNAVESQTSWTVAKPKILEVKYESWVGNSSKSTLEKVEYYQRFLEYGPSFSGDELRMAAVMVDKLHPPTCSSGVNCHGWHLTNWMHQRHRSMDDDEARDDSVPDYLSNDSVCRQWLLQHGYI